MWYSEEKDGSKNLAERGLTLRPESIKVEACKKDYDALIERLMRARNSLIFPAS
jgi:hypothetical protein